MLLKQVLELYEILDDPKADGAAVIRYLRGIDPNVQAETYPLRGEKGVTHMVKIRVPGENGKAVGGNAPTLGVLGRLGGLGARPEMIGYVSDGDGAIAALAVAAKAIDMRRKGDTLPGDLFVSTHVCPDAPTRPHDPVPFMDSPVSIAQVNQEEISSDLDAILSIDTTKGNRVINTRGFAISQPVKEGYIMRLPEELLDIMQRTTGQLPFVFPINTQDITPYGNEVHHINSIMQPCTCTDAPVIGVAITTQATVPGCGTGCSHYQDIEEAARFCLEVAKSFGRREACFFDEADFQMLQRRYGSMKRLQTLGK